MIRLNHKRDRRSCAGDVRRGVRLCTLRRNQPVTTGAAIAPGWIFSGVSSGEKSMREPASSFVLPVFSGRDRGSRPTTPGSQHEFIEIHTAEPPRKKNTNSLYKCTIYKRRQYPEMRRSEASVHFSTRCLVHRCAFRSP